MDIIVSQTTINLKTSGEGRRKCVENFENIIFGCGRSV
jgi:hypothetical protein